MKIRRSGGSTLFEISTQNPLYTKSFFGKKSKGFCFLHFFILLECVRRQIRKAGAYLVKRYFCRQLSLFATVSLFHYIRKKLDLSGFYISLLYPLLYFTFISRFLSHFLAHFYLIFLYLSFPDGHLSGCSEERVGVRTGVTHIFRKYSA